ncbi:MAG: class II aldolase/adducin family protein [Dehalococcoidia bacterium]
MSSYAEERQQVLDAARRIADAGLVSGASGNVSRRISTPEGDLIAVTASRVPYQRMTLDDVLVVDFNVDPVVGDGIPSSESLAHVAAYRTRPDVGAVIHTHSVYASAFAVAGKPIPPVLDEQVVLLGGPVEVADYGPSSSQDLADNAVAALGLRAAVLLRHHGVLGVGRDLDEAVDVVSLVERVARVRLLSTLLGPPAQLAPPVVEAESKVYRMMRGIREA